uniref:Natural cytotoxicity triggering receptor 3 n=1 Tax=Podarcis muralis TaxID=64176 RepID=A0A670HY71_PODMU
MVSQPSSAEGAEGGSVTLTCSYNSTSEPKVGSFRWVKEPGVEVRKTTREFMGRVSPTSEQAFLLERRADIEIRDLRHYDSGVYRCVVKIPGFQETSGNGTELRVLKAAKGDPKKPDENSTHSIALWAGLSSALAVFVVSPLIVLYCRNRKGEPGDWSMSLNQR